MLRAGPVHRQQRQRVGHRGLPQINEAVRDRRRAAFVGVDGRGPRDEGAEAARDARLREEPARGADPPRVLRPARARRRPLRGHLGCGRHRRALPALGTVRPELRRPRRVAR